MSDLDKLLDELERKYPPPPSQPEPEEPSADGRSRLSRPLLILALVFAVGILVVLGLRRLSPASGLPTPAALPSSAFVAQTTTPNSPLLTSRATQPVLTAAPVIPPLPVLTVTPAPAASTAAPTLPPALDGALELRVRDPLSLANPGQALITSFSLEQVQGVRGQPGTLGAGTARWLTLLGYRENTPAYQEELRVLRAQTPDYAFNASKGDLVQLTTQLQGALPKDPYFLFVGQMINLERNAATFNITIPRADQWQVRVSLPSGVSANDQIIDELARANNGPVWLIGRSEALHLALGKCRNSLPAQNPNLELAAMPDVPMDGCADQIARLSGAAPIPVESVVLARISNSESEGQHLDALVPSPLTTPVWLFADLNSAGLPLAFPPEVRAALQEALGNSFGGPGLVYGTWDRTALTFTPDLVLLPQAETGQTGGSYLAYRFAWAR